MRCCWLTGKCRREPRGPSGQRSSAVGTIHVAHANHALALRTVRTKLVIALRAEVESGLHRMAALRAGAAQRLPQEEVKNDAESVGDDYGHDRPKGRAHPAAFCVAVDIADEQHIATAANA